jgi:REP element-mobilizing transposase RayT
MRHPKERKPGALVDVTVRCHRSEFRFIPTPERAALVAYFLARALGLFDGIVLYAVVEMSNHIHLVVEDQKGQLSDFMREFEGHLAKAINRLDGVRGAVFERRFTEIEILDEYSFVRRIAYALCNPLEANLVHHRHEWAGLCLGGQKGTVRTTVSYFNEPRFRRAVRDANRRLEPDPNGVDPREFMQTAVLTVHPLPKPELQAALEAELRERERELRATQRGVLGMKKVLAESPLHRPKFTKRKRRPLCFAATADARYAYLQHVRAFVAAFRAASQAFRAGQLDASFHAYSFRPSGPSG